jgi:cytochrome c oxidase assembly protein subunit 15
MIRSSDNPWLTRFAVFTALATLALIGIGGSVTSHEAGMAVPDWPTTYGQNMFLFPVSQWVGGIFYEHTHRLVASAVGLLTTILAVWLWLSESRRWLRWLGVTAFFLVALQGVLGGLRVTLFKDQIGIFHAALAQTFLVVIAAIALATSKWWRRFDLEKSTLVTPIGLRNLFLAATLVVYSQLLIGATMRHQHAGLAIPDFPLAYGKLWPPTDPETIIKINQSRTDPRDLKLITAFQIKLHMAHRITAVVILAIVGYCAWRCRKILGSRNRLSRLSLFWFEAVCVQAGFGVWTVLSNKAADVATFHVVLGAFSLVVGALSSIVAARQVGQAQGQRIALSPAAGATVSGACRATVNVNV